MALHDQLFKRIFEFYADLLDPEEFIWSGPSVTAFNDLNVVTSTGSPSGKPFSDFNLSYGFYNFYGEMDVNLNLTEDFTIFAVVKIDFNVTSYRYLDFYMGSNYGFKTWFSFQKLNNIDLLNIEFKGTNEYLDLTGDKSKFKNKQIMLWSVKKGNKSGSTIAGIDPIEIKKSQPPTQNTENINFTSIRSSYLVLRMGFTTNPYAISGDAFKAMVSAEKEVWKIFRIRLNNI